jgi:DNA-binding transcriptional MerR regulator
MMSTDKPIYNLKAVVQETGLKPDTLRAWERRYGLPEPKRTHGGHRLYTAREIEMLKWLGQRLEEGLTISRAVALWRQLQAEKADPLAPSAQHESIVPDSVQASNSSDNLSTFTSQVSELRERWIAACLQFDEQSAEQILSDAFAIFPVEFVCTNLIQQALATFGQGWYDGKITVQQEHFASALAIRRLEALLAASPYPTRNGCILIGCPSEENHTFASLLLALLLRRRGWNILYLGADIPTRSLAMTVKETRPDLVVMTAQQLHTAATLLETAQVLWDAQVPLAYGGLVFNRIPELQQTIPGHFLGQQLDTAVNTLEMIMHAPQRQAAKRSVPLEYIAAAHHFQERRARIEADVWRTMEAKGISQRHLVNTNADLARSIAAALSLGNLDAIIPVVDWVEGLLTKHYQFLPHILYDYLAAYHAAAYTHLDAQGRILVDWLQNYAQPAKAPVRPHIQ